MNMFAREIAQDLHNNGIGVFATTDEDDRTIFVGDVPATVESYLLLLDAASPAPHQYVDTEYLIIDFWSRSSHTDIAHEKLEQVFDLLHRRYDYQVGDWFVYWSRALGSITDADRDIEGGKLFRLSVQFICRNLNHIS